ncbi:Zinc finger protein 692 [Triplophysa tibetana]|uniref:Zinc finger protein 692 n=1 Tax=Triplophysa tibetana TaxID=1572043 RepID=A0A5A9NZG7_9TELE|nr:Zinc finger protein 692 [Triplophysa tibetana]
MTSKNVLRSQRRRELDARRSKSRVRLGSCLQSWGQLKQELGFTLHSELAQHLLDSYYSRICIKCSGNEKPVAKRRLSTTTESLQELILLAHNHGQKCPLPPVLQSKTITKQPEHNKSVHETGRTVVQSESEDYGYLSEVDMCLKYTCDDGHHFSWSPIEREKSKNERDGNSGDVSPASPKRPRRGIEQLVEPITLRQELPKVTTRQRRGRRHDVTLNNLEERNEAGSEISGDNKNAVTETEQDAVHEGGDDETDVSLLSEHKCEVCGFTCRQKASLNWHMRKHNAESAYQFPCEICGRRFEKRDNVTAHRSKSHPDYSAPTLQTCFSVSSVSNPLLQTSVQHRSSPAAYMNDSTLA